MKAHAHIEEELRPIPRPQDQIPLGTGNHVGRLALRMQQAANRASIRHLELEEIRSRSSHEPQPLDRLQLEFQIGRIGGFMAADVVVRFLAEHRYHLRDSGRPHSLPQRH